jgi:nitric oxide reductase NorE protein
MAGATETVDTRPGRRTHLPADGGMWVFVLGDLVIFGAYFLIFMVYRNQEHQLFLDSQRHLSLNIGTANTLLLLTSSWFVAYSVSATRTGEYRRALLLTWWGGGCGVLFVLVKAYEWTSKINAGLTFPHNDFYMFYYMLTGIHLFHVLLGLVFLGVVVAELRNPRKRRTSMVETGATYWHMVDLLWIVIFALLYVMR